MLVGRHPPLSPGDIQSTYRCVSRNLSGVLQVSSRNDGSARYILRVAMCALDCGRVNHWQKPDLLKVELSLFYDVAPTESHKDFDLFHKRLCPCIVIAGIAMLKRATVCSCSNSRVHLRNALTPNDHHYSGARAGELHAPPQAYFSKPQNS